MLFTISFVEILCFFFLLLPFFRLLHIIQSVENRRDVVDDGFRFEVVRGDTGKVLKLLNSLDLLSIHLVLVNVL